MTLYERTLNLITIYRKYHQFCDIFCLLPQLLLLILRYVLMPY